MTKYNYKIAYLNGHKWNEVLILRLVGDRFDGVLIDGKNFCWWHLEEDLPKILKGISHRTFHEEPPKKECTSLWKTYPAIPKTKYQVGQTIHEEINKVFERDTFNKKNVTVFEGEDLFQMINPILMMRELVL